MSDEQYILTIRMQASTLVMVGLLGFAHTGSILNLGMLLLATSYAYAVERSFRSSHPGEGSQWAKYANRLLSATTAMIVASIYVEFLRQAK